MILQHILGTMVVALKFEQDKDLGQLLGYVDTDFAGYLDKHHSSKCIYLFLLEVQSIGD